MASAKKILRIEILKIVEELSPSTELNNDNIIKIAREKLPSEIKAAADALIDIAMRRMIDSTLYSRKKSAIGQNDLFDRRPIYISVVKSRTRIKIGDMQLKNLILETKQKINNSNKNRKSNLHITALKLLELTGDENMTVDDAESAISKNEDLLERYKKLDTTGT